MASTHWGIIWKTVHYVNLNVLPQHANDHEQGRAHEHEGHFLLLVRHHKDTGIVEFVEYIGK